LDPAERPAYLAGVILLLALVAAVVPTAAAGQARPPLPRAADSTGVLSAIRAIDLRQVCRCPVVLIDTTVRRSPRLRMFSVLDQPRAFGLGARDVARLAPARHRAIPAALRTMTAPRRDTALLAAQVVPTRAPGARVLVVVTPPEGVTVAFLVSLSPRRSSWLVEGVRAVYEP
jgi:hypothetical protein